MRKHNRVKDTPAGSARPAKRLPVREGAIATPDVGTSYSQRPGSRPRAHGHTIRDLPKSERPRERLYKLGGASLSTAELLSVLLGSGSPGRSSLDIGRDVLQSTSQSLRSLAAQPMASATAVAGVGFARAAAIHAALELGHRLRAEAGNDGMSLQTARDVYVSFGQRMEDLPVEEFHVGILDSRDRLTRDVTVTRGILNSSLVHPREVFREAIAERAASIIIVHNHPSGDPTPSAEDRDTTIQLVKAGNVLDIPVRDHVIIGRGRYVSFVEAGLL